MTEQIRKYETKINSMFLARAELIKSDIYKGQTTFMMKTSIVNSDTGSVMKANYIEKSFDNITNECLKTEFSVSPMLFRSNELIKDLLFLEAFRSVMNTFEETAQAKIEDLNIEIEN